MIDDDDIGTVIAIGSDYDGPCKRAEKIVIAESLAALLQKAVDKRIIRNDQRDQIIALASRDLEDDTDDEEWHAHARLLFSCSAQTNVLQTI